jgi:hypothetical protein
LLFDFVGFFGQFLDSLTFGEMPGSLDKTQFSRTGENILRVRRLPSMAWISARNVFLIWLNKAAFDFSRSLATPRSPKDKACHGSVVKT